MYETRIDRQPSIKDFFFDENLKTSFKRSVVRNTRFDGMYSYTSYLVNPNGVADEVYFKKWRTKLKGDEGFYLDGVYDTQNHQNNGNLYISTKSVKNLVNEKILNDKDFRNILDFDGREPIGYNVRTYDKKKKIIPSILQVFRLGLGTQPAVNFPPLTSRLIYEKYLNDQDQNIVWDMCSGFGGRLLGALSSNRKIKYLGTDTNTSLKGHYENLGDFYNTQCKGENDFEIYYEPAETFNQNKTYQKYKGQGDLCFTSPPYFNREQYSQDETQSFKAYKEYEDWRDNFLKPTLTNAYESLRNDRYLLWNIADIKLNGDNFHPLEQDSIDIIESLGGKYKGKLKMLMASMIGVDQSNVKNKVDVDGVTLKYEPIFIFHKE